MGFFVGSSTESKPRVVMIIGNLPDHKCSWPCLSNLPTRMLLCDDRGCDGEFWMM